MSKQKKHFYRFGPFCLDTEKRVLLRNGEAEPVAPKAFDTLLVLVQHHGEVLEKDVLMGMLWPDSNVEEANLPQNISALRKALGESPNERRYIVTIPGRGYRFAADVEAFDEEIADLVVGKYTKSTLVIQESSPDSGNALMRAQRFHAAYFFIAAAVGGLLLAAAVFYWTRDARHGSGADGTQTSVAVLPFKPLTEEERDESLETGMAEALIDKLSTLQQLTVRPLGAVRGYTKMDQDPLAAGRELRVDVVLESTLQKSDDKFRVTSRLLRVRDGVSLWSYNSDQPQSNILALQTLLSEEVAASLATAVSSEQRRLLGKQFTDNAEAYQLYLRGRFFFEKVTPEGVKKSVSYFQDAIDKDPNFALAYSGLCASYTLFGHLRILRPEEAFPAAKAALARALELDDSLSEAHSQMGFISLHYDYDWARADKEFQRAIELNPRSPMAHQGRAFYLAAVGRTDEATVEIGRALDLDPSSLHLNADAGVLFYYARRPDDAIAQLRKTLEIRSDYFLAGHYLGRVYAHKRMEEQAFAEHRRVAELLRSVPDDLMRQYKKAFALSGLSGYYRLQVERLHSQQKERFVSAHDLARLYALLGDRDRALEWLGKEIEERNFEVSFLKVNPDFDNIRSDSRFSELIRKIGL